MGAKSRGNFGFNPNPEMACEVCIFGRGEYSEWCKKREPERPTPSTSEIRALLGLRPENNEVCACRTHRGMYRDGAEAHCFHCGGLIYEERAKQKLGEGCGREDCDMCDLVRSCPRWK